MKKLPPRLTFNKKSGIYYYTPKVDGKMVWENLGKSQSAAYAKYLQLERDVHPEGEATVNEILDDYYDSPEFKGLASGTRRQYSNHYQRMIRAAFGRMVASSVTPRMISMFIRDYGSQANCWVAPLSNAYKLGVMNGKVVNSPLATTRGISGIQYAKVPKRSKEVTKEEVEAVYGYFSDDEQMRRFIDITIITGLRISDVLRLDKGNIREHGLAVPIKKRERDAQVILFTWTPELRSLAEGLPLGLGYEAVKYRWCKALNSLGLTNLRRHDLRRFMIQQATAQKLNAQLMAGHSTQAQTESYLRGFPRPVQPLPLPDHMTGQTSD